MAPEAKIWTVIFSITLKSLLFTTIFLFILISYDQYFGAESSKLTENGIKWAKIANFEAKMAPEAEFWTISFSITFKSWSFATSFLFILIGSDQYFGAESSKLAKNGIKLAKIVVLRQKWGKRLKFGLLFFP